MFWRISAPLATVMFSLFSLIAAQPMAAAGPDHAPLKVFRMGLLGGENLSDRLRSKECLRQRLEKTLGVPVKMFPAADYAGTLEGLLGGNLDYAELGPSGYARVWLQNKDAVEPIVTTRQTDGSTGYYAIMVARVDSGIKSLADMKGKVLGYADPNSTSGYLVPSAAFAKLGIDERTYFAKTIFSGGHEQNILAVLSGDVDAGVTWTSGVGDWHEGYSNGNLRKMVDKGLLDMSEIREIWRSPLIPNGPIVVRKSLPPAVKAKVKASLLALAKDDPDCMYEAMFGSLKGLIEVGHDAYATIVEARRRKNAAK